MRRHVWLIVSLVFGIGYWLGAGHVPVGPWQIALKGGGVAALAVHALARADARTRAIALALALGALGDMLFEVSVIAGAGVFLLGHFVAIGLYWANRRLGIGAGVVVTALAVVGAVALIGGLGVGGDPERFYVGVLACMVAAAGLSRFRRDRVLLGALLFAASDFLLIGRMGVLAGSVLPGLLIWPLYYFGQVLIAVGVVGL